MFVEEVTQGFPHSLICSEGALLPQNPAYSLCCMDWFFATPVSVQRDQTVKVSCQTHLSSAMSEIYSAQLNVLPEES